MPQKKLFACAPLKRLLAALSVCSEERFAIDCGSGPLIAFLERSLEGAKTYGLRDSGFRQPLCYCVHCKEVGEVANALGELSLEGLLARHVWRKRHARKVAVKKIGLQELVRDACRMSHSVCQQNVHDGDVPVPTLDALPVAAWQAVCVVNDGCLNVAKATIWLPTWVDAKGPVELAGALERCIHIGERAHCR